MTLVERYACEPSDKDYNALEHICFLGKNLYNSTPYAVRQHYFNTGEYLSRNKVCSTPAVFTVKL